MFTNPSVHYIDTVADTSVVGVVLLQCICLGANRSGIPACTRIITRFVPVAGAGAGAGAGAVDMVGMMRCRCLFNLFCFTESNSRLRN